jgi:alkylated DNA nucleotide flippase Atl1
VSELAEFTEEVLAFVERIPAGRVVTYGLIADHLGGAGFGGGARHVGRVMALEGAAVPWWRVVRANGSLPPHLMLDAQKEWAREKTPVKRGRVDVAEAVWHP